MPGDSDDGAPVGQADEEASENGSTPDDAGTTPASAPTATPTPIPVAAVNVDLNKSKDQKEDLTTKVKTEPPKKPKQPSFRIPSLDDIKAAFRNAMEEFGKIWAFIFESLRSKKNNSAADKGANGGTPPPQDDTASEQADKSNKSVSVDLAPGAVVDSAATIFPAMPQGGDGVAVNDGTPNVGPSEDAQHNASHLTPEHDDNAPGAGDGFGPDAGGGSAGTKFKPLSKVIG